MTGSGLAPRSISVIIPTLNRKDSLLGTLDSLQQQIYPKESFEIIIVDDGGNDGTDKLAWDEYQLNISYHFQANQGAAAARNCGVRVSGGDILIFIDDDVTLDPRYLAELSEKTVSNVIAMGRWLPFESSDSTVFNQFVVRQIATEASSIVCDEDVSFTECGSANLAVCREDFLRLGMWRNVLGDGPTLWGDVEFGFRAWEKGFRFMRVADAGIVHRDQLVADLQSASKRAYHTAKVIHPFVVLHPGLLMHLDMFVDKVPIDWHNDALSFAFRKVARKYASSRPIMGFMEKSVLILERVAPESRLLTLFYRWIVGGYVYRGYRDGMRRAATKLPT